MMEVESKQDLAIQLVVAFELLMRHDAREQVKNLNAGALYLILRGKRLGQVSQNVDHKALLLHIEV